MGETASLLARASVEGLEQRTFPRLDMRVGEGEEGTFEGYACLWNVTDSYGTRFVKGAFSAGGLDTSAYALLWMHDPWQVVGQFLAEEDNIGLRIAGAYDDTPEGQTARTRARSGSAPELSVGFVRTANDPQDLDAITGAMLVETSQITARMAAVPGAALTAVRSKTATPDQRVQAEAARARLLLAIRTR